VAQSTGSIEPRCGRPATSPWAVGHVLAHFQKPFYLCVQQRRYSRYPMSKAGARRLTTSIRRKIQDNVVDVVSEALSMHMVPPAIRTVVVPVGVTILLELHNPPRSWM
jgi:hypothetical protein